jgi:hypothetical protein
MSTIISEATARQAAELLSAIVEGHYDEDDHRVISQRRGAAAELLRLFFVQEKQAGEDKDRPANGTPRPALTLLKGRAMSELSEDELAELRDHMTADFPGRTKPS